MKRISEREIGAVQKEITKACGGHVLKSLQLQGMLFQACENHNSIIERLKEAEKAVGHGGHR